MPVLNRLLTALDLIAPTEFRIDTTVRDLSKPLRGSFASSHRAIPRICIPDGATLWSRYLGFLGNQSAPTDGKVRAKSLRLHLQMFSDDIYVRRPWFKSMDHYHKRLYDEVQLLYLLAGRGSVNVSRKLFHKNPHFGCFCRRSF